MSELTCLQLPLDKVQSRDTFAIDIQFINHKITFKIFAEDSFADVVERALFVLDFEARRSIGFLPEIETEAELAFDSDHIIKDVD